MNLSCVALALPNLFQTHPLIFVVSTTHQRLIEMLDKSIRVQKQKVFDANLTGECRLLINLVMK